MIIVSKLDKYPQQTGPAGLGANISYDPVQAAVVTGRSRSRIFKAIKDKELTARKDGRATLIEADELRRWVQSMPTIGRAQTEVA
ncbi:helix-turn-helix domain-containing protein [Bradyrhizobium sp. URHD0069]|uniref:helix-turn-helix domain-containing protein n=1 Tax=Bradyrhizobium sp. URHD0069 TaxID=1380355 RepID=UPI000496AF30|nr:helix-turn-helix domain-containing protein [Bradyrhizobium sp. URHD0069]